MNSIADYTPVANDPFGRVEQVIWENAYKVIRNQYRNNIEKHIENIENEWSGRKCPKCKGKLYGHGYTIHTILTLANNTTVTLHKFRCSKCHLLITPGTSALPYNKVSAHLMQVICYLITQISYKNVSKTLKELFNLSISPMSIHKYVNLESKQMQDRLALLGKRMAKYGLDDFLKNNPPVDLKREQNLYIGIDGGHVKGWKKNKSHEIKCVNFATGSKVSVTSKNVENVRYELQNRYGYATNDSIGKFANTFRALSIIHGALSANKVIVVTDGATWIKKLVRSTLPDAIHLLDIFHLKSKINKLFTLGADSSTENRRIEAIRAVDAFDSAKILSCVQKYNPPTDKKRQQLDELVQYIRENEVEITNHKLTHKHGSGMIEKAVDLLVSRRMKLRGMSWTKKGSSAIMPFKVMQYNNTWDLYWSKRKGDHDLSDFVVVG